ncbi:MAG: dihydrofolate reductase family protein [Promethearchaeota archaeon]
MNRKIILNIAISLDGFIADKNGEFAWIKGDGDNSHDTETQMGFSDFAERVDTIVMGKNAYFDCGFDKKEIYPKKQIIVATSKSLEKKYDNVEFFNGDICKKVLELKKNTGKDIWLFGGGGLADWFLKDDIVDEFIIGVVPIILGEGKLLFLSPNPTIELHLEEYSVKEGMVLVKYTKRNISEDKS